MKKVYIFILVLMVVGNGLFSQNTSKTLQGVTMTERNAIANPVQGMQVLCGDCGKEGNATISVYNNGHWNDSPVPCCYPPTAGIHIPSATQIIWHWNYVFGADGYLWNTVNDLTTAVNIGLVFSKTETGLTCNTPYTRYIWAYNVCCGQSLATQLTESTLPVPFSPPPTAGTNVPSMTQIIWNWNAVPGATGYKWNTINDWASATDMGSATTKTETGLTPNTPYTRYAWAYDACGNSTAITLSQTTLTPTYCLPSYSTGCSYGDGLTSFILGTINTGTITCPPWYHDYTALSTTMHIGSTYTLTVQAGYPQTFLNVYIDYNDNYTFNTSELIGQVSCGLAGTNYTITFTVPGTALTGTTRMRALTEWIGYPSGPCTGQTYGNCCDFTVNIIP